MISFPSCFIFSWSMYLGKGRIVHMLVCSLPPPTSYFKCGGLKQKFTPSLVVKSEVKVSGGLYSSPRVLQRCCPSFFQFLGAASSHKLPWLCLLLSPDSHVSNGDGFRSIWIPWISPLQIL